MGGCNGWVNAGVVDGWYICWVGWGLDAGRWVWEEWLDIGRTFCIPHHQPDFDDRLLAYLVVVWVVGQWFNHKFVL